MKDFNYWTVEICTGLARVKIHQKNNSKALEHLETVKKLLVKKYPKNSLKLVPLLNEMAEISEPEVALKLHRQVGL